MRQMILRLAILCVAALHLTTVSAQTPASRAPGWPGDDAHWPTAAKIAFGTANTLRSKVWFTLAEGVLTEVFYPTVDTPNVQALQLVIVTPEGKIETEKEDTVHSIELLDNRSLTYRQINRAKTGKYAIYKTYVTDPRRAVLLIDIAFHALSGNPSDYKLYTYYDPSLKNSGMHDSAWSQGTALLANEKDVVSALVSDPQFDEVSSGYLGRSDVLTELRRNNDSYHTYDRADDGNVVQGGRVATRVVSNTTVNFTLALGFGNRPGGALAEARAALAQGFDRTRREYQKSWWAYVARLPQVESAYRKQFQLAVMVLLALEDKTHRGAMIASPSAPWGGGPNANEPTVSGYHVVWSRDLYHVATAFLAADDRGAATRALDYLFKVQQRSDGSFPQNSWVDGRPIGGGLQMDQVALPLILAYQLGRFDRNTWLAHIRQAADFIVTHGPTTNQERWEEESGYSPSTIAAEIAGLVCAGTIARRNGDVQRATEYERVADLWLKSLDAWTATTTGQYADGKYYVRVSENDNPNDGATIEINSNGGVYDEREIVDAGFLELVRLGIKRADDPLVLKSLDVIDQVLRVQTEAGDAWYRYNHDAYGERPDGSSYDGRSGRGRLWTFLTGERGQFEIALGRPERARARLSAMLRFANEGGMLAEQVWDRSFRPGITTGSGTGSATPLAWSMAQFIRLAVSLKQRRNVETPRVVAQRYLGRRYQP